MRYQPSRTSIARSGYATASGWISTAPLALIRPWRPLIRISGFSFSCQTHSDCQRMKGREIGIGPGRTDRHPGLPEALAFEGPVAVSGLSIGQRSTLEL